MRIKKEVIFLAALIILIFSIAAQAQVVEHNRRPTIAVSYDENDGVIITSAVLQHVSTLQIFPIINSTPDNKTFYFTPEGNLINGNYTFTVKATDLVGNEVFATKNFSVNILFSSITLVNPPYGVSQTPSFDLIIETGDPMEGCKYSQGQQLRYADIVQSSNKFTTSQDGITHTISPYTLGTENQEYPIYVVCNNTEGATNDGQAKLFKLSWDSSAPTIKSYPLPPKAIEELIVELKAESLDNPQQSGNKKDKINCRFSSDAGKEYKDMEYWFSDSGNFTETQSITLTTQGAARRPGLLDIVTLVNYTFYVQCQNMAGLLSNKERIDFSTNLEEGGSITDSGPNGYVNTQSPPIYATTSRPADCEAKKDSTTIGMSGNQQKSHTATLSGLSDGEEYTYSITCRNFFPTGDEKTVTIKFTVDLSEPSTPDIKPKTSCSKDSLEANVSATDNIGIQSYEYTITDENDRIIDGPKNKSTSLIKATGLSLEIGKTYTWTVVAYDRAGNPSVASSAQTTVLNSSDQACLEKDPPTVTLTTQNNNDSVTVTMSCYDASGCKNMWYTYVFNWDSSYTADCSFDETYMQLYNSSFDVSQSGKICYKAIDNAQNQATGVKNVTYTPATQQDDEDGDGYTINEGDCNDTDANINPLATETCDQKDNNCNQQIDENDVCSGEDTDGDGLPDDWEEEYGSCGFDINNPMDRYYDFDNDGLYNFEEYIQGTNPCEPDTDGDGFPDGGEITSGTDPLDPESFPTDTDNDGIDDRWEINYFGDITATDGKGDFDSDGLSDYEEYLYNTDPTNKDTDGEGLLDGEEVHKYKTSPKNKDTDGDSYSDYDEIMAGTDPLDPNSYPKPKENACGNGFCDADETEENCQIDCAQKKSSILAIILLIIGLIMILAGSGYLYYKKHFSKASFRSQSPFSHAKGVALEDDSFARNQGLSQEKDSQKPKEDPLMEAMRKRLELQRAIMDKKRAAKEKERLKVFSAFEEDKSKIDQKITQKEVNPALHSTIKKRQEAKGMLKDIIKQKEEDKKRRMEELGRRQKTRPVIQQPAKKDEMQKLDEIIRKDTIFDKLDKMAGGQTPEHIQEMLEKLSKEKSYQEELAKMTGKKKISKEELDKIIKGFGEKKAKEKEEALEKLRQMSKKKGKK